MRTTEQIKADQREAQRRLYWHRKAADDPRSARLAAIRATLPEGWAVCRWKEHPYRLPVGLRWAMDGACPEHRKQRQRAKDYMKRKGYPWAYQR